MSNGQFEVNQKVTLGSFPQSDASGEKKEPVEWIVLAVEGDKALLISEKGLDCRVYHGDNTTMTWENCELRKWLNGEFLEGTFTAEEQAKILTTPTPNPDSTPVAAPTISGKIQSLTENSSPLRNSSTWKPLCADTDFGIGMRCWRQSGTVL